MLDYQMMTIYFYYDEKEKIIEFIALFVILSSVDNHVVKSILERGGI